MRRQSFIAQNHSIVDSPIHRGSPELWRASVQYKALAFRHSRRVKTLGYELKAVRAVWDENIGPSGGWRCPEGTEFGGYITDRFGRGCGWGIARRIGNAITDTGRRLGESLDRRRTGRDARSTGRQLRRSASRRRGERRGIAQQVEGLEGEEISLPTPIPDKPWLIERFLNQLADLLAPKPREQRESRSRRRQDLDEAAVSVPRPTVDRPSDEPVPLAPERVRTRRPLVDPDNPEWSSEKAAAVRTAYNKQRDLLEQEWRRRLRLGPDDEITIDMVNDYVEQRRAQSRSGGYLARLRAMAESWAVMRDPLGDDDDLIDRLNRLNPRRGRQILAEADSNVSAEPDQEPIELPVAPVERESIRVPAEEVEVVEPESVTGIDAVEAPDVVDVQEVGRPPEPYENMDPVTETDFSGMQGNTEKAKSTKEIIRRLTLQAEVLKREFGSATGVNRNERARILLARARRIYRDSRQAYDAIRFREGDDVIELLRDAQRNLYLAQSMEKIVNEVGVWIDGFEHVLPESSEEVNLEELASIDIPGLNREITDDYGRVDQLIEQIQAADTNRLRQMESLASGLPDQNDIDMADANEMTNERMSIVKVLRKQIEKLSALSAFNGYRKATTSDGRGKYRHLPPLYQDALYRADFDRRKIFRDGVATIKSVLSRLAETDQMILDSELKDGPLGGHVGDPRVFFETLRLFDRDLRDEVYENFYADNLRRFENILRDLRKAIDEDDGEQARRAAIGILDELFRVFSRLNTTTADWLSLEERETNKGNLEKTRLALNVAFRVDREYAQWLLNVLDDVDALNLHDHSDRRPLLDRDPGINRRSGDMFNSYATGVRSVIDENQDGDYPIPGTGNIPEPTVPQLGYIDEQFHIFNVDNDQNLGGSLRERVRDISFEVSEYEDAFLDDFPESILEMEDHLERLEDLRKNLKAAIEESRAIYDDETRSYNDRIIAGYRIQRLESFDRFTALRKLNGLGDLIAEERRRLGPAAPPLRNIPDRPTLDDIKDPEVKRDTEFLLREIDGDWGDEVFEVMAIRSTEDIIDFRITLQNRIDALEESMSRERRRDQLLQNAIIADRYNEVLDRVEDLIDSRRDRRREFLDVDAVLGQALADTDYETREEIDELVDAVIQQHPMPSSMDDLTESEQNDFEVISRRVYQTEKETGLKKIAGSLISKEQFNKTKEELLARQRDLLNIYSSENQSLRNRLNARLQVEAILELLAGMQDFETDIRGKFLFDADPSSLSPEEKIDGIRNRLTEDGLDPDKHIQLLPNYWAVRDIARNQQIYETDDTRSPATRAQDASVGLGQIRSEMERSLEDYFNKGLSRGFDRISYIATFGDFISQEYARSEIDRIFADNPDLTDYDSVIGSTIETPTSIISNDLAKSRRQRSQFAARMLSTFKNFMPKRRNRFRGQIANTDGTPRLISNPKIQTTDQAVEHVLRGGSLDEVPNHLWHVAIDENSSDLLEDRSTRFYRQAKRGGMIGDTRIYLVRGDDGYPVEQGWVFKGVDDLDSVVGQVLGSWYLYSLGFPVEGAGYDGVRKKSQRRDGKDSRHYVILPYVGNAIPDGPLMTAADFGQRNYSPGVYRRPISESGSWMATSWQPIAARLHALYASAFLGLADRHSGNAIAARVEDGVVIVPIDLDTAGTEFDGLDSYLGETYMDMDEDIAEQRWINEATSSGEGLQAIWAAIQILDEHIRKSEEFLSIGEDLFVALLTEGSTGNREDVEAIAVRQYAFLLGALQQLKEDRSDHVHEMILQMMDIYRRQGLPEDEYNDLLVSLVQAWQEAQDANDSNAIPDFWISAQQDLLRYG